MRQIVDEASYRYTLLASKIGREPETTSNSIMFMVLLGPRLEMGDGSSKRELKR